MSLHKFRFLEPLSTVTPVYNALLVAGDKITDVFAKVQGLLKMETMKAAITADVSGGASTTADINVLQMTIDGGLLTAGDFARLQAVGNFTKPVSAGSTVTFWAKVNNTKVIQFTITPTNSQTNATFAWDGMITFRTVGAGGTVMGGGKRVSLNTTGGQLQAISGPQSAVDTTANVTVTIGFTFSNSNASNNVTTSVASIELR